MKKNRLLSTPQESKNLNLSLIPKALLNEVSQKYLNPSEISNLLRINTASRKINQRILDDWQQCQQLTVHATKCIPRENLKYIKKMHPTTTKGSESGSAGSTLLFNDRKCNKYCDYYDDFNKNGWEQLQYHDTSFYNNEEKKIYENNSKVILYNPETNRIGTTEIDFIMYVLTFEFNNDTDTDNFMGTNLFDSKKGFISFNIYPDHDVSFNFGPSHQIEDIGNLFHSLMKLIPNKIEIHINLKMNESVKNSINTTNNSDQSHQAQKKILLSLDNNEFNDRLYFPGNNQWWNWDVDEKRNQLFLYKYKYLKQTNEKIDKYALEDLINQFLAKD